MRKLLSVSFVACCSLLFNRQASGQTINTFAGGPGSGTATNLAIQPNAVVTDTAGNVYIADNISYVIRKVDKFGTSSVIAGTGFSGYSGDGGPATAAQIGVSNGLVLDAIGNLYIADNSTAGIGRIRKINLATGIITTFAGGGTIATNNGDGHRADSAQLTTPNGVALDAAGNLYIADGSNHKIRKVDATTGIITTIVGLAAGGPSSKGYNGNGRADTTKLNSPVAVSLDAAGNVYFGENANGQYLVRKLTVATNMTSTIAGTPGFAATLPIANGAHADTLNGVSGLTVDAAGNVYFPDNSYHRVIKIDGNGFVTVVAGVTAQKGYNGDNIAATAANMINPKGVAFDKVGNMYIAEFTGQRVRKVDTTTNHIITTVAGNGLIAYTPTSNTANYFGGDGGIATSAQLKLPKGISIDAAGNVLIYDLGSASGNPRIRKINTATHIITTIAGNGQQLATYTGDTLRADTARLYGATTAQQAGVVADANGNVFISDGQRVRKIDALGRIIKVAGNNGTLASGQSGYSSDGGRADTTRLNNPAGLALDAQGNLYIADYSNSIIRKVDATTGVISKYAGSVTLQSGVMKPNAGYSSDGGSADTTRLNTPSGIVFDTKGNAYIADYGNNLIRKVDNTGKITTYAGSIYTGTPSYSGDGFSATAARLKNPSSVAVDTFGNLYIADKGNNAIRKVNSLGNIYTIAGTGTTGYNGNNKRADSAQLASPYSMAVDVAGTVYIADYTNNLVRTVTQGIPTLSIAKSKSTICTGDTVTFTATPTYGGTTPAYQWYVNGIAAGSNSNTYKYVPASGDSVSCVLTSNDAFALKATATNGVKLSVTPLATTAVSIAPSANNICSGAAVTYTATATNGGTAPAYQWTVNGANAGTGATYSYNPANNDVVSCVMTSNVACPTQAIDTSNSVTMNVTALVTPSVNVAASANNICSGTAVTYTATATNGGTPAYQWKVNGANVATGATYSYNPANNDVVSCVLTSNAACTTKPTDTNSVTMNVTTTVTPAVSIAAAQNNICSGIAVSYTATATNGGTTPAYQWTVNGANVGTNADTFSYNPANNDVVNCVLTSNAICASKANDTSSNVTMVVNPSITPTVSVIAPAGITVGQQVTFNANVTNGGANPQYQWRKNGADISGATQASYTTTAGTGIQNNDQISVMVTNTDACGNAATSNALNVAISTGINDIGGNNNSVSLYPNPNDGTFTVKATVANKAQQTVVLEVYNTLGQSIYKEEVAVNNGTIEHQVNLSKALPAGNYFLKLNDGQNSVIRFTLGGK